MLAIALPLLLLRHWAELADPVTRLEQADHYSFLQPSPLKSKSFCSLTFPLTEAQVGKTEGEETTQGGERLIDKGLFSSPFKLPTFGSAKQPIGEEPFIYC